MTNKLPKFIDKHKICIICEGNEEYEYLKRLKALWKFNPVRDGEIDVLHDMPVTLLSELRNKTQVVKFISVKFDIEEDEKLKSLTNKEVEGLENVILSRYYDGNYKVSYPEGFEDKNKPYFTPELNI